LPSIPYHQLEVVIIVDGGAYILVVVLKFCKRYTAILLEGVPLREELFKNLVLCKLPILELGVVGNIIDISEIL
jgi:preprotein translocase subunit Sss1